MSTFDKLCWFAERFPQLLSPSMASVLRRASLFRFPHVSHEVLPKHYTRDELDFQNEFFHLPFRVVAIEDLTSCVLLWDDKPDQVGLRAKRWFVELASLSSKNAQSWNDGSQEAEARSKLPQASRDRLERAFNFSFGALEVHDVENTGVSETSWRFALAGNLVAYHMLDDDGPMAEGADLLSSYPEGVTSVSLRNAMTGIEELMVFNRPDRFIVRETPAKVRSQDGPKIPRSHERDTYTLLRPQEARSKLGLPEPTGRSGRFVGERRRHVRRYPDDPERWPNAHGKTVVIPATWVGPHEANVGRRKFSIMLDL
jgi:hypothetical protein